MPKRKHSCDGEWTNTQLKTFVNEKVFSEKSQQAEEIMKNVYDKTTKLLWAGSKSTFSNIPKTNSGTSSNVPYLSTNGFPHSGSMQMDTTDSNCPSTDVDCSQLRIGKSGQLISAKEALIDLTMGVNNNGHKLLCPVQSCHTCGLNLSTTFKLDCHWCSCTICPQCTETCPKCHSSFCSICIFSEHEAHCPRCL